MEYPYEHGESPAQQLGIALLLQLKLPLKVRQDQLTAAREEAKGQLEQRRAELPTTKEIRGCAPATTSPVIANARIWIYDFRCPPLRRYVRRLRRQYI